MTIILVAEKHLGTVSTNAAVFATDDNNVRLWRVPHPLLLRLVPRRNDLVNFVETLQTPHVNVTGCGGSSTLWETDLVAPWASVSATPPWRWDHAVPPLFSRPSDPRRRNASAEIRR